MKFIPMLYSTPMVQALLEGRKLMTRRTVKPQPDENGVTCMPVPPCLDWEQIYNEEWKPWQWETDEGESIMKHCPYGKVGDVIWVRETFVYNSGELPTDIGYLYKADLKEPELEYSKELEVKWKPSLFMPKAACRIFLQIENIRVERLHDISHDDAVREGIEYENVDLVSEEGAMYADYKNYMWRDEESYVDYYFPYYADPISSFKSLWHKINGTESWNANPWVWVISFKRIERPANFLN